MYMYVKIQCMNILFVDYDGIDTGESVDGATSIHQLRVGLATVVGASLLCTLKMYFVDF